MQEKKFERCVALRAPVLVYPTKAPHLHSWPPEMRVDIYLNFPGNCEEAFRFYERELNGKVTTLSRHGDVANPNIPKDWSNKVLHAWLEFGNAIVMGADIPNAQPMRSAYVTLTADSVEEAERMYGVLREGGEVFMKMEETFFAKRFAMLRDRFGISWMLLHAVRNQELQRQR